MKIIEPKVMVVGNYSPSGHNASSIVDTKGVAPTVRENHGTVTAITEPICLNSKVNGKQPSLTDRIYDTNAVSPCVATSQFFMGSIAEPIIYDDYNGRIRADQNCIGTLTTNCGQEAKGNGVKIIEKSYRHCRIRKLPPRETFRLMGFDNTDFDNAAYGGVSTTYYRNRLNARTMTKAEWKAFYRLTRTQTMSNSQLYKQAGNSIVTAVLMAIFGKLLAGVDYESKIAELVERLKDDPTHD